MARRKKRSRRHASAPTTPIVTYTVTVAHEPNAECDACCMPRPTLIEQESGAWICEMCAGLSRGGGAFWSMAFFNGIYDAAGDGW